MNSLRSRSVDVLKITSGSLSQLKRIEPDRNFSEVSAALTEHLILVFTCNNGKVTLAKLAALVWKSTITQRASRMIAAIWRMK